MKKTLSLVLTLALCMALVPCAYASTGNVDYDYIITLLDRGEYDLAISIIEMLRDNEAADSNEASNSNEAPDGEQTAQNDSPEAFANITEPGEAFYDAQVVLQNGTDYCFHVDLFNASGRTLTLAEYSITNYQNGSESGCFVFSGEECAQQNCYRLDEDTGAAYEDWHPCPAPFDLRIYSFTYQDDAGNIYKMNCSFDMNKAVSGGNAAIHAVDYSQDSGKDLQTLRYEAAYEVEVADGIYWVPARTLGESRYTNAEMLELSAASPEEKQAAVSTLYEALQLYQVGGFCSADDNVRIRENGFDWEHHKPGYYAVLTNCGCCATDSNWLHYILDGDYDEIGYIATSQADGSGHVFNYILLDSWYYVIDLTHYRTDWIATATEDGNLDSYYSSDFILGNIHKTQSLEAYASYMQDSFDDPPALIVKYTASDVPAVDSVCSADGSVVIVYAQMNDVEPEILFDNPNDQVTFRMETAPAHQPEWSE